MKVGDLVTINRGPFGHTSWIAGEIGVVNSLNWDEEDEDHGTLGAYVLFTQTGQELWFEDDELEVINESR